MKHANTVNTTADTATAVKAAKNCFTTGQLAKIFGVKKQTLFHYDRCGIFCPEYVGENGYRFYSFTQLETFATILMLREVGLSIASIKAHMDNRSPEALVELLEERSVAVDERIRSLQRTKAYIDKKIKTTRLGLDAPRGEILEERASGEYLLCTPYVGSDDEKAILEAAGEHFAFCQEQGMDNPYPIGAAIPVSSVTSDGYRYSHLYTGVSSAKDVPESLRVGTLVLKKAGRLLSVYDDRGYTRVHESCLRLAEHAKVEGLRLGEYFFEDVILDDLSTSGYYSYLVRVSVTVG